MATATYRTVLTEVDEVPPQHVTTDVLDGVNDHVEEEDVSDERTQCQQQDDPADSLLVAVCSGRLSCVGFAAVSDTVSVGGRRGEHDPAFLSWVS